MLVERLGDAAEVQPIGADAKNPHAAHAVERLQDDVAVHGVEALDRFGVARDQRRRDPLREFEDRELFGVVAECRRPVEHARAFALGLLQQVSGVEVFAVERRILAHQHRVDVGERQGRCGLLNEPVVRVSGQRELAQRRFDAPAALPHQVFRLAGEQRVPARSGLAHHREGRVLVGLEDLERIGDEQQFHDGGGGSDF